MPSPGFHVGEYSLVRRVAVGAMSEVYEGRHRSSGEPAAVKLLRPHWCLHAELVARFLNEASALQELRHPHLVKALDSGLLPEGNPFMLLEWLPVDLQHVLTASGGSMPFGTSVQVILQLAGALEALHTHGLIHRDLKPANVLLAGWKPGTPLEVKLADLGLAKHTSAEGALPAALPVSTADSAILGTWDYMAPEQWLRSKKVGAPADVYALGVLWFQLLAGRLPFIARAEKELMVQHVMEPPPLELLEGKLPGATQTLLALMLHKKASRRPSLRELQEHLSAAHG